MNDQQIINLLKGLVIDGVDQAQSGHPGGAMSSMDFAYTLFAKHLRFDPDNPNWLGRDRFILSAGHESMLLYSLLYANGWLNLEDLKGFRQLGSRTPGHPENGVTPGVECTTGPLGQGAAMSVGFAIGSSHLAAVLDQKLFQSRTWVLMGDGCMQEGVTLGAASIAGHLKLGHLIWYYDKNCQQISGSIDRVTSDDEKKIFEGFGWQVLQIDGHNHDEINRAISAAKQETSKPTLIVGRSLMAHGAANVEGSHKTHGAPLSPEERKETKLKFAIPSDESFYFPNEAKTYYQQNFAQLRNEVQEWQSYLAEKRKNDVDFNDMYNAFFTSNDYENLPLVDWQKDKPMATRNSFGEIISCWAKKLPTLIGGSADLEPSNMTEGFAKLVQDYGSENPKGRNLAFGVREFPMSAICNGLALYGGFVPFDATFLSFADYSRAALRLGSIQHARVIHEFTHDSFYVGEDGPTHQPIEHIMSLRAIPNMYVMRPADSLETEVLMRKAVFPRPSKLYLLNAPKTSLFACIFSKNIPGRKRGLAYTRKDKPDSNNFCNWK
ncbi:MAG: transketolase [Bdellovibrionota bacterium]